MTAYLRLRAARAELRDMLAYWADAHTAESRRRVRLAVTELRVAHGAAWDKIGELAKCKR